MGNNKVLHLVLKKKWYEMIDSGIKIEEYRDINYLYCSRLLLQFIFNKGWCKLNKHSAGEYDSRDGLADGIKSFLNRKYLNEYDLKFKNFDSVCFHYGYTNKTISFKIKEIVIDKGNLDWGAEENKEYFVIRLGEKL